MRHVYKTKVFKGPNLIVTNQFYVKTFQNSEILWKRLFSFAAYVFTNDLKIEHLKIALLWLENIKPIRKMH